MNRILPTSWVTQTSHHQDELKLEQHGMDSTGGTFVAFPSYSSSNSVAPTSSSLGEQEASLSRFVLSLSHDSATQWPITSSQTYVHEHKNAHSVSIIATNVQSYHSCSVSCQTKCPYTSVILSTSTKHSLTHAETLVIFVRISRGVIRLEHSSPPERSSPTVCHLGNGGRVPDSNCEGDTAISYFELFQRLQEVHFTTSWTHEGRQKVQ